jgi:hypothetical protein
MRKLFMLTGTLALAGCELPPLPAQPKVAAVQPHGYHDVAYYDAHPMEREQTNSWCGDNPGLAAKIPSCDSADTSGLHAWHRKMGWENGQDQNQTYLSPFH